MIFIVDFEKWKIEAKNPEEAWVKIEARLVQGETPDILQICEE